jgi:2,4-dienoyl-CoA reductase-like NADH-dependent reductase (Old Yellow Enzyme family)
MPVMVTGGIRRRDVANQAIEGGVDMVSMATALAIDRFLPADWRSSVDSTPHLPPVT